MVAKQILSGLALAFASVFAARAARASGFSVERFASEQGHPTTSNPTALYFNPAALTLSNGSHLFADLSVALRRVTYDRPGAASDAVDPPDAPGANTGRAQLLNPLVNPALVAVFKLGPLSVGVGFFTPFGGTVSWDKRPAFLASRYPGIADGVTRFHSIEGQLITSQFSLGAALRVAGTGLSLGMSGAVQRSSITDLRAWNGGENSVVNEGRSLLTASGYSLAFGLGAVYELSKDRLWLGLSYQSRPNVSGGLRLRGALEYDVGTVIRSSVDVLYDLPDVIRWGVRYRPSPELEIRAFGDYTRFSAFKSQCVVGQGKSCTLAGNGAGSSGGEVLQNVPRAFRDSLGVRLGVSLWPTRRFEFFSGLGADSSAVPPSTLEAGLPDWAGVSFTLGGCWTVTSRLHLAISLSRFVLIPREVHSQLSDYAAPSRMPDASGHYTEQLGVGNINADFAF